MTKLPGTFGVGLLKFTFLEEMLVTNELEQVYAKKGLRHLYFDTATPCDLYRGQSRKEAKQRLQILYPNPGFLRRDGSPRLPDVFIEERDGKQFVRGCRTVRGNYRGVSTFDRRTSGMAGFRWYKLPKQVEIPAALAVTQDSEYTDKPNHFTIAPKDDMTLELFLVWLNALNAKLVDA